MVGGVISALTRIGDKVLGAVLGRPLVRLSIRTELKLALPTYERGPRLRDVVVRAVNVGQSPLQIEALSIELDDGTEVALGVSRPAIIAAPGYLERSESRKALADAVGTHRIARLVAVRTDGVRHRSRLPKEWQTPATWPP